MYKFHPDYEKNRLYVASIGIVTLEDFKLYMKEVKSIVKKLQPGFSYIHNMLELEYLNEDAKAFREKANKLLYDAGVGPAIRIIPPNMRGVMRGKILNKLSASIGFESHMVHSIAEAEKLLEQLENK